MKEKLKQLLSAYLSKEEKILLALSGGSDSMGLFHALIDHGYFFEVCTIDHRLREDTQKEIFYIQQLCRQHGIPFHLRALSEDFRQSSNLEDRLRSHRYALLREIYEKGNFKALVLGHHADDQVETILKRLLEGASLPKLAGMKCVSERDGMRLVRPLLSVRKMEIASWLKSEKREWFEDHTNCDRRFLRGRMRSSILPFLQKEFGKEFFHHLLHFASRMDDLTKSMVIPPIQGPWGQLYPIIEEKVGLEWWIRQVLDNEGVALSRVEVDRIEQALRKGEEGIEIRRGKKVFIPSSHGLFTHVDDCRDIDVTFVPAHAKCGEGQGWKRVFCGRSTIVGDLSECHFAPPRHLAHRLPNGARLSEIYRIAGIPPHLRKVIPVIWRGEKVVGECLTGRHWLTGKRKWVLTFNEKKNTMVPTVLNEQLHSLH